MLRGRNEKNIEDLLGVDQFGSGRGKWTRKVTGILRVMSERT